MKGKIWAGGWSSFWSCATAACLVSAGLSNAEEPRHLSILQPGGMPGIPVMTGIEHVTNGVKVTWDGPSGYYQLSRTPSLGTPAWQNVGGPSLSGSATDNNVHGSAFYRVSGPSPQYAGSATCAECHSSIYAQETKTRHPNAFVDPAFIAKGGQTNNSCLPCHTVGFGLPTGFVSARDFDSTNYLAGVQCENCHSPAGNHAANPGDFTVKPRVDVAATVCGGCHAVDTQPTYTEWKASGHAEVTEPDMDPNSCGRCHIGSARIAMLKSQPVNPDDTNVGVVCAVCHDPHAVHVHANALNGVVRNAYTDQMVTNLQLGATYTNSLRNPFSSSKDYFLTTSDVFATKYDPEVNVCGQCHNHRGADWRSTSRPPHHSPQYNMLIGTVGELPSGSLSNANNQLPATHSFLEKQCVSCHMQMTPAQDGPPPVPANTAHRFAVERYDVCLQCHPFPEDFVEFTQGVFSNEIHQVKVQLDNWALVKQGGMLGTNYYGALCWEYTNAGDLSQGTGPNSADQALIPENIKKARFNLYLVFYDGSFGVHNGLACGALLQAARDWVAAEMAKRP